MDVSNAAVIAVVLPALAGAGLLFGRRSPAVQRGGLVAVTGLNLAVGVFLLRKMLDPGTGPTEVIFGGWTQPVGIAFYVDTLSAIMVVVSASVAFCGALFALGEIGRVLWCRGFAFFFLLLVTGINGAFLTSDLFNLFVWFEVMLMASFAMMVLGRRPQTFEGSTKYVTINVVSSFFFLSGLGVLYGKVGSLNLNDVASRLVSVESTDPWVLTSASLLLLAFGIKAGVFPLYFWLPAAYPNTGFTTAAVFGGLLTKVGVYALFRVFGGAFGFLSEFTGTLFLLCGAATMVVGVFGAASQFHTRKILSFHIVSQIGYLVLGLGLFTEGAIAAAIFYTAHHIIVKTNLFFAAGLIATAGRSERLERLGGLFASRPGLALLFAVPALSLGGIPPLSGFFAKFLLIRETFRADAYLLGAIALGVGILTLFSMTKIWAEAFWKDHPAPERATGRLRLCQVIPVTLFCAATVAIGLFVGPLFTVAEKAAAQLRAQNPGATESAETSASGFTAAVK